MRIASLNIIITTIKITTILISAKDSKDIKHKNLKQLKLQCVGSQITVCRITNYSV